MRVRTENDTVVTDGQFIDDPEITVREFRTGRGKIRPASGSRESTILGKDLEPVEVVSERGLEGWCVRVPGGRPLPTPAVVSGKVFIGGGFGSHEFYAFDAATGHHVWRMRTKDDGPTAAVVEGDRVAFNTESCTIYVVDTATGSTIWEKWLGDPLLAQPAIADGSVVMVYPDRSHIHRVACFGLEDGVRRWESRLSSDVITAPVIAQGAVHLATLDGTLTMLDLETGTQIWSRQHRATSAPWVHRGEIYVSLRERAAEHAEDVEGIDAVAAEAGTRRRSTSSSRRYAQYLKYKKMSTKEAAYALMDAGVGFAAEPAAAKLHMAREHLGLGRVSSVWAYQGSRPEVFDDGIHSVMDDVIQKLELDSRRPRWRAKLVDGDRERVLGRVLNPPAVTEKTLYVTSGLGDLVALDRESGEERWALSVPGRILGQPSFYGSRAYLATSDGLIFSFETGEDDSLGWPMWGGGPGHNGTGEDSKPQGVRS